jgi:hypothetical protein
MAKINNGALEKHEREQTWQAVINTPWVAKEYD